MCRDHSGNWYVARDQPGDHPPSTGWTTGTNGSGSAPTVTPVGGAAAAAAAAPAAAAAYVVSGCGMAEFNGQYVADGRANGAPRYRKQGGGSQTMNRNSGNW